MPGLMHPYLASSSFLFWPQITAAEICDPYRVRATKRGRCRTLEVNTSNMFNRRYANKQGLDWFEMDIFIMLSEKTITPNVCKKQSVHVMKNAPEFG